MTRSSSARIILIWLECWALGIGASTLLCIAQPKDVAAFLKPLRPAYLHEEPVIVLLEIANKGKNTLYFQAFSPEAGTGEIALRGVRQGELRRTGGVIDLSVDPIIELEPGEAVVYPLDLERLFTADSIRAWGRRFVRGLPPDSYTITASISVARNRSKPFGEKMWLPIQGLHFVVSEPPVSELPMLSRMKNMPLKGDSLVSSVAILVQQFPLSAYVSVALDRAASELDVLSSVGGSAEKRELFAHQSDSLRWEIVKRNPNSPGALEAIVHAPTRAEFAERVIRGFKESAAGRFAASFVHTNNKQFRKDRKEDLNRPPFDVDK